MSAKSIVKWDSEVPSEQAIATLVSTIRKTTDRKSLAEQYGVPYELLLAEWGEKPCVKKHFFYGAADGYQYPKYPPQHEQWKHVIGYYTKWHYITSLDALVDLWLDLSDGILGCPSHVSGSPFATWIFSTQCKFALMKRKHENEPRVKSSS